MKTAGFLTKDLLRTLEQTGRSFYAKDAKEVIRIFDNYQIYQQGFGK